MDVVQRITPDGMFRHGHLETPPAGHGTRRPDDACGTSSSTSVNAPSSRCAVTATAQPSAVGAPGGSGSFVVRTDRECAWEARSESDWLVISDSSGRGDGTMRYTAAGNPVVSERRGAVVVNGVRVEIGQAAAACAFNLDRLQQSIGAAGGRIDVSVSAQAGCAWTARSDAPWISVASGAAGQGSGTVSLSVSANATAQTRSSVVTIAGQPYLIEQAGAVIGDPVPPPPGNPGEPGCVLTVSPRTASVGAEGGRSTSVSAHRRQRARGPPYRELRGS